MILNSVRETVAEPYFLSILQHLLSIRDDIYARSVAHTRTHTHTHSVSLTHSLTPHPYPQKEFFWCLVGWLVAVSMKRLIDSVYDDDESRLQLG